MSTFTREAVLSVVIWWAVSTTSLERTGGCCSVVTWVVISGRWGTTLALPDCTWVCYCDEDTEDISLVFRFLLGEVAMKRISRSSTIIRSADAIYFGEVGDRTEEWWRWCERREATLETRRGTMVGGLGPTALVANLGLLIASFFGGRIVGALELDGNCTDLKWFGFILSTELATEWADARLTDLMTSF